LLPIETAVEQVKTNTRRFARRQLTWFRRDADLRWYEADAGFTAENKARRIVADLELE
jgi:tRNA dimethylallyltransferase